MDAEPPRVTLVLGGARSGKSSFAQQLAERSRPPVLFVATATGDDAEMAARIEAHRAARPETWRTVEVPLDVGQAIWRSGRGARTVLLDCLSLLVSNCLVGLPEDKWDAGVGQEATARVEREVAALMEATRAIGRDLIVVSNEVGMGIVPEYPLGRVYRDLLGLANQQIAQIANAVYLVVAGIPVDVKALHGRVGY